MDPEEAEEEEAPLSVCILHSHFSEWPRRL